MPQCAKAGGERLHSVPVTHPDDLARREPCKERIVDIADELGEPIFPIVRWLHAAAQAVRHQLHPVADPEDRHPRIKDPFRHAGRAFVVNARWATGQNEPLRIHPADIRRRRIKRHQLGEDAKFTHPPGDQLGRLGAEVDYGNRVRG